MNLSINDSVATLQSFVSQMTVSKLFPHGGKNETIDETQWHNLISKLDYLFVDSVAIRKEYTNFVLLQKKSILKNVKEAEQQAPN